MIRRFLLSLMMTVAVFAAGWPVRAGQDYEIKLKSGAVYRVRNVDADTVAVSNGSGKPVGTIEAKNGRFEVSSSSGVSLGTAANVNPEALMLLDAHIAEGGA